MKVTDLDQFSLEQIWRPYQGMMGYHSLEKPPHDLLGTIDQLRKYPGWRDKVISRLRDIGISFPSYIVHPLVEYLLSYGVEGKDGKSRSD